MVLNADVDWRSGFTPTFSAFSLSCVPNILSDQVPSDHHFKATIRVLRTLQDLSTILCPWEDTYQRFFVLGIE